MYKFDDKISHTNDNLCLSLLEERKKILEERKQHLEILIEREYQDTVEKEIYKKEIDDINNKLEWLNNNKQKVEKNKANIYLYNGPVYAFNKLIYKNIHIVTNAVSISKAKSNILYQIKEKLGKNKNSYITIDEKNIKEI